MKLLVVGTKFGSTYLEAAKQSDNWEIAGIMARSDQSLKEPGKKYDIPEHLRFKNIDEAIEKSDCDAVAICVPNASHFEIAKKALEADKHIFIEKPITETWEQAAEILSILNKKPHLRGVTGQTLRGDVIFRMMEYQLNHNVIGKVESLTFESHWYWVDDPKKSWRFTLPDMFLDDIGIHQFDLIRMLLGNKICHNITAMAYKPDSYPYNIRTTCSSSMLFQDNIMVNYFGSMGTKGNPIGWTGKMGVYGDRGILIRDEKSEPYIQLHDRNEKIGIEDEFGENADDFIPLIEYTGIAYLMEDLFHALREHRQSVADLRDNIYSHKILLGTKKSADYKRLVHLEQEYKI